MSQQGTLPIHNNLVRKSFGERNIWWRTLMAPKVGGVLMEIREGAFTFKNPTDNSDTIKHVWHKDDNADTIGPPLIENDELYKKIYLGSVKTYYEWTRGGHATCDGAQWEGAAVLYDGGAGGAQELGRTKLFTFTSDYTGETETFTMKDSDNIGAAVVVDKESATRVYLIKDFLNDCFADDFDLTFQYIYEHVLLEISNDTDHLVTDELKILSERFNEAGNGFFIYVNGQKITENPVALPYTITGLQPATQYSVQVSYEDTSGNESKKTTPAAMTTLSPPEFDYNGYGFAYAGNQFHVLDTDTGAIIHSLNVGGGSNVNQMAVDPRRHMVYYVAAGGWLRGVELDPNNNFSPTYVLGEGLNDSCRDVFVDDEGMVYLVGDYGASYGIRKYDPEEKTTIWVYDNWLIGQRGACMSPWGIVGCDDGEIVVIDPETGTETQRFQINQSDNRGYLHSPHCNSVGRLFCLGTYTGFGATQDILRIDIESETRTHMVQWGGRSGRTDISDNLLLCTGGGHNNNRIVRQEDLSTRVGAALGDDESFTKKRSWMDVEDNQYLVDSGDLSVMRKYSVIGGYAEIWNLDFGSNIYAAEIWPGTPYPFRKLQG